MSRRNRHYQSLGRQVALFLIAIAAIGFVMIADELIRHGLLVGLAGPIAGYAAGRMHAARRNGRLLSAPRVVQSHAGRRADNAEVIRLRAEVEALTAERDQARLTARAAWQASTDPGVTRAQLLADPRSGARPLGSDR